MPDGPLPDPDTPAPPRFLPEYDNLALSHADRSRVFAGLGPGGPLPSGRTKGTLLVDGFYRAIWSLAARGRRRDAHGPRLQAPGLRPARRDRADRGGGRGAAGAAGAGRGSGSASVAVSPAATAGCACCPESAGSAARPDRRSTTTSPRPARASGSADARWRRRAPWRGDWASHRSSRRGHTRGRCAGAATATRWPGSPRNPPPTRAAESGGRGRGGCRGRQLDGWFTSESECVDASRSSSRSSPGRSTCIASSSCPLWRSLWPWRRSAPPFCFSSAASRIVTPRSASRRSKRSWHGFSRPRSARTRAPAAHPRPPGGAVHRQAAGQRDARRASRGVAARPR